MSVLHLSLPVRRLTDFSAWRLLGFNRTCEPTDQRNCLFTGREIPVCHQLGREEEGDYALRAGRRWHGLERNVFFDMTAAPGEDALDGIKDQKGNLYVSGPGWPTG